MPSTLFLRRRAPVWRCRQFDTSFPGFGKPDRNGLLGVLNSVLPFPDMVNLFADEFSRLRGRRLTFASILAGAFNSLFFGHVILLRNLP